MQYDKSEQYSRSKEQLVQASHDANAVRSLLGAYPDGGKLFVDQLYQELRLTLVQGQLEQAEQQGELIAATLPPGAPDSELHRSAMTRLLNGIRAVLDREVLLGVTQLEKVLNSPGQPESLQWAASIWISKGELESGDMGRAADWATRALSVADRLDSGARALSLAQLAEVEHLRGNRAAALFQLEQAATLFSELNDMWGEATAHLTRARIEETAGMRKEATASALCARDCAPHWEDPVVFLAHQALTVGDTGHARAILQPLLRAGKPSRKVLQEIRLAELYDSGSVPPGAMAAYCSARDQPPDDDVIERLHQLSEVVPSFLHLRELLGWKLLKRGRDDEANDQFRFLSEQALDPDLQASVLLALGCLANRRHRHRQPAARLNKAAAVQFDSEPQVADSELPIETDIQLEPDLVPGEDPADEPTHGRAEAPAAPPPPPPPPPPDAVEQPKSAPKSARSVFTGELQLLPVPDLLDFLKTSRRSGTLVISSDKGVGAIHLRGGKITGAAAPNTTSLGEVLLASGDITEARLKTVTSNQKTKHPDQLLGSLLVRQGGMTPEAVRKALVRQVTQVIIELLRWEDGRFAFEPERDDAKPETVEVELDTQGVLLDALREFDEMNK